MPLPAAKLQSNLALRLACRSASPRGFLLLTSLLTVSLLQSVSVSAQQQEPSEDEVVRVNTELLLFPVRLQDKRGQVVSGLTEKDLSLKDNDHVITGLYFSRGADRLALVFALDQSGSLRDIISQQRDAALALFRRFSERSQVAVVHFSDRPTLAVPFGRDSGVVLKAFDSPPERNRSTAIFDAAAAAVNAFELLPRVRSERRLAILISDGLDTSSSMKPSSVIDAALKSGVSFYVIHIPLFTAREDRLVVRSPAKGFRELAERTGGKYFLVGDAKSALLPPTAYDLTPVFQAIEDDLRSQYILGFYTGEGSRDGRKHRFTLSMPSGIDYQINGSQYSRTHDFFVGPSAPNRVSK